MNPGSEFIRGPLAEAAEFGEDVGLEALNRVVEFVESGLVQRSVRSQGEQRSQGKRRSAQGTLQLDHR